MTLSPEQARTTILYGDSGLGKSANAREFAKLAYEITGLPVRLISHEVSSQVIFADLIRVGIVHPMWLFSPRRPIPAIRRLSRGDWAYREEKSGLFKWQPWDGKAGAYIYEGLTSASEILLANQRDEQRMMAEQKEKAYIIDDDGEKFMVTKSSMTNFDVVQNEILDRVKEFGGLPVWRVLWTAHETKGEDEDTKQAIRGPALVGKAKTGTIQKWCSMLLHLEGYPVTEMVKEGDVTLPVNRIKRRIWFEPHPDMLFTKINYPAKVTIPPAALLRLTKKYPSGYFAPEKPKEGGIDLVNSLADFMRFEESLVNEVTDATREWKQKVDAARTATTSNVGGDAK